MVTANLSQLEVEKNRIIAELEAENQRLRRLLRDNYYGIPDDRFTSLEDHRKAVESTLEDTK